MQTDLKLDPTDTIMLHLPSGKMIEICPSGIKYDYSQGEPPTITADGRFDVIDPVTGTVLIDNLDNPAYPNAHLAKRVIRPPNLPYIPPTTDQ